MNIFRYYYDELAWIGLVAGIITAMMSVTWFSVNEALGMQGLIFSVMLIAGFALHPRMSITVYDRAFSVRNFATWITFVILGFLTTGVLNWFIINPYILSRMAITDPLSAKFLLVLAAIAETFFFFWFLQSSIETYIHPFAGVLLIPVAAGLLHWFVYGPEPIFLLAVTASFLVQAVIFAVTRRLSIPLFIHLVVNLIA